MTRNPLHWSCVTLLSLAVAAAAVAVEVAPAPRPAELTPEEANAKAALALSLARHQAAYNQRARAALEAGAGCGVCRTDLTAAQAEARRLDRVIVVFVGGCGNNGQVAAAEGAVPVRVKGYPTDADTTKQMVVIYPYRDGRFYQDATLPAGAAPETIKAAVRSAVQKKDAR